MVAKTVRILDLIGFGVQLDLGSACTQHKVPSFLRPKIAANPHLRKTNENK